MMVAHMMATDAIVATAFQNAGMVAMSDWNIAMGMLVSLFCLTDGSAGDRRSPCVVFEERCFEDRAVCGFC